MTPNYSTKKFLNEYLPLLDMEVRDKVKKGQRYQPSPLSHPSIIVANLETSDSLFDKNEIDWSNLLYFIKESINTEDMNDRARLIIEAIFYCDINQS